MVLGDLAGPRMVGYKCVDKVVFGIEIYTINVERMTSRG